MNTPHSLPANVAKRIALRKEMLYRNIEYLYDGPEEIDHAAGDERDFMIARNTSIKMCWVPSGDFLMGSDIHEKESKHWVKLTKGFWLAKTPITWEQWDAVIKNIERAKQIDFRGDPRLPTERVSYSEIYGATYERTFGFLGKINHFAIRGSYFHLPTEAQWEFACRAESQELAPSPLNQFSWNCYNSNMPQPVGLKQPNKWGLCDMIGNVWELCADAYDEYPKGPAVDPEGSPAGWGIVIRGGSFLDGEEQCRYAARAMIHSMKAHNNVGFRLACSSLD